jgi:hypothetical protein
MVEPLPEGSPVSPRLVQTIAGNWKALGPGWLPLLRYLVGLRFPIGASPKGQVTHFRTVAQTRFSKKKNHSDPGPSTWHLHKTWVSCFNSQEGATKLSVTPRRPAKDSHSRPGIEKFHSLASLKLSQDGSLASSCLKPSDGIGLMTFKVGDRWHF